MDVNRHDGRALQARMPTQSAHPRTRSGVRSAPATERRTKSLTSSVNWLSPRIFKAMRAKPEPPRFTPVVLGSGASDALNTAPAARLLPCASAAAGAASSSAATTTAQNVSRRAMTVLW